MEQLYTSVGLCSVIVCAEKFSVSVDGLEGCPAEVISDIISVRLGVSLFIPLLNLRSILSMLFIIISFENLIILIDFPPVKPPKVGPPFKL